MVLASSREAEAPGEVYHRVIMGALHYRVLPKQSWWNDVKSPVEGLNITDRYEVLACVIIILEHVTIVYVNSTIKLYSFLIQNTHFGTKVY